MRPAGQLFITGMLRSGTSLLQTLLTNHAQIFAAYQPYNQLYVDVKADFLREIGVDRGLPLGDGVSGVPGEATLFNEWLDIKRYTGDSAVTLVRRSVTGKGGSCADLSDALPRAEGSFAEIQAQLHGHLAGIYGKSAGHWIGSKEILCEEYLPYLLRNGRFCLLIVRDPRAVVASANSGRYRNMVGDRYPTLMLARIWRKSVAYALALRHEERLQVVRYEDLAKAPGVTLDKISDALGVEPFPENSLGGRLLDHKGEPWLGNSSFGDKSSVDGGSISSWENHLPTSVARLTEALCYPEMIAMGYVPSITLAEALDALHEVDDDPTGLRPGYAKLYELSAFEREREIARLMRILDGSRETFAAPLTVRGEADGIMHEAMRAIAAANA